MKNDKVNGLFLRPFPWVGDVRELYEEKYVVRNQNPWYLVEVVDGDKTDA